MKFLWALSAFFLSCSHINNVNDPNQWLEEVEGEQSLTWVKEQNQKTQTTLEKDPRFHRIYTETKRILSADDRLSYIHVMGNSAYHFYQSDKHRKGLYRRMDLSSYINGKPKWEAVLDLDALAKSEKEDWVWKGLDCLEPEFKKCMIYLSRGGKDAKVAREFDLSKKMFVANGFFLPESKGETSWINENQMLIATDFGKGTMTDSGYPRQVRLWNRGQDYRQAKRLLEADQTAVSVSGSSKYGKSKNLIVLEKHPTFYESEFYILTNEYKLVKIQVPNDAIFWGLSQGQVLFETKSNWRGMQAGTLFSVDQTELETTGEIKEFQTLFTRTSSQSLLHVAVATDHTYITYLDNVRNKVARMQYAKNQWQKHDVTIPDNGMAQVFEVNLTGDIVFMDSADYLKPSQIWYYKIGEIPKKLYSLPERFSSKQFVSEQKFATSKDGTKIPYTIIRNKNQIKGPFPTILYGYGGFENSLTPNYLSVKGKTWLERGGVYVVANTRGGGEFGPEWHQSVIKENRQKVFDDFIAVAEALIASKIASTETLAIEGYSNGGLLVGAVMVQRPELFKAVICGVPLLDMLTYHKLLAGASWIGEYGNPEVASERKYIAKYSPYQNLKEGVRYPNTFLLTSTKDDRVHPGHARKMAARMLSMGAPVTYYENIDGGHGAAADIEGRAKLEAYRIVFLLNTLF